VATGQVRTTPARLKDPKTRGRFTFNWQIRLVAIGFGLLAAFLDMEWKTVDKYFPKLNKVLHAGFPTTHGDVDYLIGHLQKDLQTLGDPCTDDMTFEQCGARIIANKSVLEDYSQQVSKLDRAWAAEARREPVPEACQVEMNQILAAYKEFDTTERDVLGVLESMDSEEATKRLMPTHNAAEGRDIAAWQAIRRLRKSGACKEH
jgi:hypothetical protein